MEMEKINMISRKTKTWITKAINIHGDIYDYSLVEYTRSKDKVNINCKIHGVFEQRASNHLVGRGCPECGNTLNSISSTYNTETWLAKAINVHGDRYGYDKVVYVHSEEKIIITCKIHGDFEQIPKSHLQGTNCFKCNYEDKSKSYRSDTKTWLTKVIGIHGDKYDYSSSVYVKSEEKLIITCKIHGDFEQTPHKHLLGHGCSKCAFDKTSSKAEQEIIKYLKTHQINNIITSDRETLIDKELDIYLPDYNFAIEFNGLYWHSDKFQETNYHLEKTIECNKLGINLIHIFEDEWSNQQNIVKSRLSNLLGKITNKIYSRDTVVKIIDTKQYHSFTENNHLDGYREGSIYLGLFYTSKETNKEFLVSVMSFGQLHKVPSDNHYELLRFGSLKNIVVIGAASKLLKYFENTYKPEYIVSYVDRRWSQGNLLKKLNFELIRESKPNYFYVNNRKRVDRFTNKQENMNRIYDCGNYVFGKLYLR